MRSVLPLTSAVVMAMNAASAPAAPLPAESVVTAAEVQLAATQALIMTGTDMHTVDGPWMSLVIDNYINPTLGGLYTAVPVTTPAEFWPFGGLFDRTLDDSVATGLNIISAAIAKTAEQNSDAGTPGAPIVVFGYSQSAIIATMLKRQEHAQTEPPLTLVLIGNPNRPNGGVNARFGGMVLPGWTFSGPTPTDTGMTTIDIARQYDPFADFPKYPLNPFALANTVAALFYAHNYSNVTLNQSDPAYNPATVVQHVGDTTYYLILAEHLPLLQPLWDLGVPAAVLGAIEPTLRTLVEAGYDRASYGEPSPARLFPTRRSASPPPPARAARITLPANTPVQTLGHGDQQAKHTIGPVRKPSARRAMTVAGVA